MIHMPTLTLEMFTVEQTGGGCTALVHRTVAGPVAVLTDNNFGTDLGAYGDPTGLIFDSAQAWESGDDPSFEVDAPLPVVLATLATRLEK